METNTKGDVKVTLVRRCLKVEVEISHQLSNFFSERELDSSHNAGTQTHEWDWEYLKGDEIQQSWLKYPIKMDDVVFKRGELERNWFNRRIPRRLCKSTQTGEDTLTVHKEEKRYPPAEMQTSKTKKKVHKNRKQGEVLTVQQFRARLGLPPLVESENSVEAVDASQYRNVPFPEVEMPIPNEEGEIPQLTLRGDIVMYKLCRKD